MDASEPGRSSARRATDAADRRAAHDPVVPVVGDRRHAGRRWSDDPDLKRLHESLMVQLSRDLFNIRDRQGWSLDEWARVSGVHADTVHAIEQARTDPQVSTLIRLLYPAGFSLAMGFRPSGYNHPNPTDAAKN